MIEPDAAAAAFALALPIALLGMAGAVVSTVRDAPDPVVAESAFVPPEFAGFSSAMRVFVPIAISTLGALAVLVAREQAGMGDDRSLHRRDRPRRDRDRVVGDATRPLAQRVAVLHRRSQAVSTPEHDRRDRNRRADQGLRRRARAAPLDLVVPAGQRVSLIGHNGSGKTTLIRLLTGMLEPSAGSASVAGHPAGSIEARAALAHLADQPVFYDDLSVREHLEYVARLHGRAEWEQRADELLEVIGLTDRADDLPSTFSRGLRQKAAICLAFVRPFEVMVVDEPFVGLDRAGREALLGLFRVAHGDGADARDRDPRARHGRREPAARRPPRRRGGVRRPDPVRPTSTSSSCCPVPRVE